MQLWYIKILKGPLDELKINKHFLSKWFREILIWGYPHITYLFFRRRRVGGGCKWNTAKYDENGWLSKLDVSRKWCKNVECIWKSKLRCSGKKIEIKNTVINDFYPLQMPNWNSHSWYCGTVKLKVSWSSCRVCRQICRSMTSNENVWAKYWI